MCVPFQGCSVADSSTPATSPTAADYEQAIAEFRSHGNIDDADALTVRALAIARQRGGTDGNS